MRKRLQIALMATAISFLSTLFATMPAHAQPGASSGARAGAITPTTDEAGRKIYVDGDTVNGEGPSASRAAAATPSRSPLVYWSSTAQRVKPVPTSGAAVRS